MSLTEHILDLAETAAAQIPADALSKARLSLLDWMVCGLAGRAEPLAVALRGFAADEGGAARASVIAGPPAPARMAALVNGATSHALDYDDTHFTHVGHLSVGIYPAALAMAEELDLPAGAMIEAFALGAEAAIRIGAALGPAHYNRGFHQTATAGAFGATVAAGRLRGLTRAQMRAAIGLCATRASGLKSQFGTMGKPYNAGIAAANGVECAALAARGLTSAADGLEDPQGFLPTHSDDLQPRPAADGFLFARNKYKLHACCHGTHAMIEGLLALRADIPDLAAVERLTLRTAPRWLRVCDKKAPRTGLEVKFSYAWLAGMVLRGDATGDDRVYTDALAADPALADFAARVTVAGDGAVNDLQAAGEVALRSGRILPFAFDLDAPISDAVLAEKLRAKARAAIGAEGEAVFGLLGALDGMQARRIGAMLAAKG